MRKLVIVLIINNLIMLGIVTYLVPTLTANEAVIQHQSAVIAALDAKVTHLTNPLVIQQRTLDMLLSRGEFKPQ